MSAPGIAAPAALVLTDRCHFCSKLRPAWRVHRLAEAQTICDYCLDWHNNAIEVLAGGVPKGCQPCGATWEKLRDFSPGVEVRMYVVPRDGIYQLLCQPCLRLYAAQRADLYRGTRYGETLK